MRRLHLLDGTYELFRSYFGSPTRTAPDGTEIGAVHGLLQSTLRLIEEHDVTHLAAAFDTVIRSFRNDLYAAYKTEAGVPGELLTQFPLAEEGMEALGVTVWRMVDFEADDALATAVERYAGEVDQVVILTPDKDLAQCVDGSRVIAYDRRKAAEIDEAAVIGKFGVPPASIPDYLALVGDSADGFPGLPGWGAKSASMVLARYRHLEGIPLDPDEWSVSVRGAARLADALAGGMEDALLFRHLATLRDDVPLEENLDDLRWRGVPRERFLDFCDRWGFGSIRERPDLWLD